MAEDTPHIRVAARAIIVREGNLLVQFYEEGTEIWCTTPGGGVEHSERLDIGLQREVFEELGLTIQVGSLRYVRELRGSTGIKLLGGLSPDFHQLEHFFEVNEFEGEPVLGEKTDNYATRFAWIPLRQLAEHQFFPGQLCERLYRDHQEGYPLGAVYLGDA